MSPERPGEDPGRRRIVVACALVVLAACSVFLLVAPEERPGDRGRPLPSSTTGPGEATGATTPSTVPGVGPDYYGRWPNGPSTDPSYFPIGVWLQNPEAHAEDYKRMGINLFVGLSQTPPAEGHLRALAASGVAAVVEQNDAVRNSPNHEAVQGWFLADEPDMNQPNGTPEGGGCIEPATIQQQADRVRAADPTRPTYLNLGKGAAIPGYNGRGPGCYGRGEEDFYAYAAACDICSVDYYAVTDPYQGPEDKGIWAYGRSIDRMREFAGPAKPVWGFVETTAVYEVPSTVATPEQVKSIVWMSLIHGARGIEYFAHAFYPRFRESALLDDPAMVAMVTAVNARITALAPVLNSPTLAGALEVASSNPAVPVDTMVKSWQGRTHVFSIGGREGQTTATFTVPGAGRGTVEVIGEGRTLPMVDGRFEDSFGSYQVHLYRLAGRAAGGEVR